MTLYRDNASNFVADCADVVIDIILGLIVVKGYICIEIKVKQKR